MSNWYLEEHCASCGEQLATNGKLVWCTNKGCLGSTREDVEDGTNSHKSIHKER